MIEIGMYEHVGQKLMELERYLGFVHYQYERACHSGTE
jgi:hypothetical protein